MSAQLEPEEGALREALAICLLLVVILGAMAWAAWAIGGAPR